MEVPEGAGLIIRTAGSQRDRWPRSSATTSISSAFGSRSASCTSSPSRPAKIYEEGDIIKRSIRDLYSKEIDEVIVEGPTATATPATS
jgi:ribonuclease E